MVQSGIKYGPKWNKIWSKVERAKNITKKVESFMVKSVNVYG